MTPHNIQDFQLKESSTTRPNSGTRSKTCRINFIEHNKQRIKLMSANSKSRAEAVANVVAQNPITGPTHHNHSNSTTNLNLLMSETLAA